MSSVKCYDVVKTIIDEATKRYKPIWVIDKEKLDILEEYCGVIDSLASEFGGSTLEVEVSEETLDVIITLHCNEVTVRNENHIFYQITKRAKSVSFELVDSNTIALTYVFPSVWKHS